MTTTNGLPSAEGTVYRFGDFELDTRAHELRFEGKRRHVEPQVFDVLFHLLASRDRLVTRDELLDKVWGHRYVAPTTLSSRIKHARQAVGDDGDTQRVIRTVHGLGFRVVAEVEERGWTEDSPPAGDTPAPEQRIQFCTAPDGVRIAYAAIGAGPLLVKPADWVTHLESDVESPVWRHWVRELSRDHTLVRIDRRGSGLSDRAAADLSFDSWVSDLETVVDDLGLERFPLFGICQGCAVAVAYAARNPERVTKLVLYAGFAQGRLARATTQSEIEEASTVLSGIRLGWERDDKPAFQLFFAEGFIPGGTLDQVRWFADSQRATTSAEVATRMLSISASIDVTELAAQVRAPTLVLHPKRDVITNFEEGRKLAALIPGARFVPLDSKNHVLLEHEPAWARFVDEVRRFLAEDTDRSSRRAPSRAANDAALTKGVSSPPRRSARRTRGRSG
jgi:pimeloyl-ACP methyl ester carboxylesterase/DNA-binding winged helix-turn-helix (wHTH) protein